MLALRHASRFLGDLFLFTVRSGRWWVPLLMVVVIAVAAIGATAEAVVPVLTYTLF